MDKMHEAMESKMEPATGKPMKQKMKMKKSEPIKSFMTRRNKKERKG